jgi:phage-related protein
MSGATVAIKPVFWMGTSKTDLKSFPRPVQSDIGYALFASKRGEEYRSVKARRGLVGEACSRSWRPTMATRIARSTP